MNTFCKQCGAKLNSDAKFCTSCGFKNQEAGASGEKSRDAKSLNTKNKVKNQPSSSKKTYIIAIAAVAVLILAIVFVALPKLLDRSTNVVSVAGDLTAFTYTKRDYKEKAKEFHISPQELKASYNDVRIDFGEFGLEKEETLEIKELPVKIDKDNGVKVTAYDFSIGNKTEFEDVITITIPYDEKYVEEGKEGECVGAKYYNQETGEWETIVYELDINKKQVIIYTTHLSTYGVFQVKNENTRKAYITDIYAVASLINSGKSFEVLKELGDQGKPGNAAFEAGFEAVNYVVGNTGNAVTIATLGGQYEGALAESLGKGTQHLGLALSMVQTCYDFTYNFSDDKGKLTTLANLTKNIANNAVGYFGSASLQVGFAAVSVFDMVLSTTQSDMVELKLENIGDVYQYYNDVEEPRSVEEWRKLFMEILKENSTDPQAAQKLIEDEVNTFCDRFWNLKYGKVKEIAGVSGKKYSFDERNWTNDRQVLTEQFKAHLYDRLQAPMTSARKFLLKQAQERAQIEFEKQLRALQKELNKTVKVQIIEQPKEEDEFKFGGYTVRFAPLSSDANKKNWTGKLSKSGELNTSFTVLGHMQSGMPNQLEVYPPGKDTPELTVPFKVTYPVTTIYLTSEGKDGKVEDPLEENTSEDEKTAAEAEKEYAWVLVDTVNETRQEDIDNTNKGGIYHKGATAQPGNYTFTWKYVGESDNYYDPDMLNGESFATQLSISVPPSEIKGGERIELSFNLTFTEENLSYFDGNGGCRADWGNIKFKNSAGKNFFNIYSSVKYSEKNVSSISDTIFAEIPSGEFEGQQEKLWTGEYSGTYYIYEWRQIESKTESQDKAEDEYVWVLTETKTNNWQEGLANQNASMEGQWKAEVSASPSSAVFKITYIGKTDGSMVNGMTESGEASWSAPSSSTIKPDEEFSLQLNVKHIGSTRKYPSASWSILAQSIRLDENGNQSGGSSSLSDKNGATSFTSGTGNNYESFSPTVYGKFGAGSKEGERRAVEVVASGAYTAIKTTYIFEWKKN